MSKSRLFLKKLQIFIYFSHKKEKMWGCKKVKIGFFAYIILCSEQRKELRFWIEMYGTPKKKA